MDTITTATTPKRHLRSWQRRKQARPAEILESALSVFAEKGFAAARMEDIALKAGVTKGTIYLYFPSKEEVFKSLAREHCTQNLIVAAEQAEKFEGSVFEFLKEFYGHFVGMVLSSEAAVLPKIIIGESGNFPELARFWREEVIEKATVMMAGVMARAKARGEIRDLPTEVVCKLAMAPILMCLVWRTTFEKTDDRAFDYDAYINTHCDVFFKGIAANGTTA
jgi:AcrR family transcriptional regulator